MTTQPCHTLWILASLLAGLGLSPAQIPVNGVADEQVYADQRSFSVPLEAGYTYTEIILNGQDIPGDTTLTIDDPDYYELYVERRPSGGGLTESSLIQFIVRSSARGNSETGLPVAQPFPLIQSAAAEFAGARLEVIAPSDYPQGLEIPLLAIVENADGTQRRANGVVQAANVPGHPVQVRRGWGSVRLPPAEAPGPLTYDARLHHLASNKVIRVEAETTWTSVSGGLAGEVNWPENSRISVEDHLVVLEGATLNIGAGSVIRLGAGVELQVNGALHVHGTSQRPVVFTPATRSQLWGGIVLRTNAPTATITGAILTGGCADPNWMAKNNGGGTHRGEQPLIYVGNGAEATLTDVFAFDCPGQFGHGESGLLTLRRCLVQRFTTFGQFNGGTVDMRRSAAIEFPIDSPDFVDADNDGLYLAYGIHHIEESLIGWLFDDGIDAGSGSNSGSVTVTNCWIESCFHEALAYSGGGRVTDTRDSVLINNGQGLEAGWSSGVNSPVCYGENILAVANLVGARFGDNYNWTYNGFLTVTNSILIHNDRDVWGFNWADWTYRTAQMDIRGNWLTRPNARHPDNATWSPADDAHRLAPFRGTPHGPVGLAFTTRNLQVRPDAFEQGVPVGLSMFSTNTVTVRYTFGNEQGPLTSGTLSFQPGEVLRHVPVPDTLSASNEVLQLTLSEPTQADLTGPTLALLVAPPEPPNTDILVATGSEWKYLDDGTDQGTAWRSPLFDDSAWQSGRAELGYGDGDEATVVSFGGDPDNKHTTTYFRRAFLVPVDANYASLRLSLKRDDGAVVHLNGQEFHRDNMPAGTITHTTFAFNGSANEGDFLRYDLPVTQLKDGLNVLAVEIHQDDLSSSDISFDLELAGASPTPPPRVQIIRAEAGTYVVWADVTAQLQVAETLTGPWQTLSAAASPHRLQPGETRGFFRLRRP